MDQTSLRVLLIVLGIIVLLAIYGYDKMSKQRQYKTDDTDDLVEQNKVQPTISTEMSFSEEPRSVDDTVETDDLTSIQTLEEEKEVPHEETIPVADPAPVIQLIVIPSPEKPIDGVDLLNVFTEMNLEFGDMGIFHRYHRHEGTEEQLFHVANLHEPGTFPVGDMKGFDAKGIVVFFQAGAVAQKERVFDEALEVARELSQRFGAELVDDQMKAISFEKIDEMRESLLEVTH